MKRMTALLLALCMLLAAVSALGGEAPAVTEEPDGPTPFPEIPVVSSDGPQVTVLKENVKVIETKDGFRAVYIAQVRNNTDDPLYLRAGLMTVTDTAGNQVGEARYFHTCGSRYLDPGEVSFVSLQADLAENVEIICTAGFEVKDTAYRTKDTAITLTDPAYIPPQEFENGCMKVTVVNDTGAPLKRFSVICVLKDAEGNLLDIRSEEIFRHELGVNSTLTMYSSIERRVTDYFAANGIEPAAVEALGWTDLED